jgi:hypothetical protein
MLARPLQLFVYDIPSTVPHMGLPLERQQQASLFLFLFSYTAPPPVFPLSCCPHVFLFPSLFPNFFLFFFWRLLTCVADAWLADTPCSRRLLLTLLSLGLADTPFSRSICVADAGLLTLRMLTYADVADIRGRCWLADTAFGLLTLLSSAL